ncbi:SDR family NAD(P)-dependent oxidoreductase [Synechococcus sp. EJ6-Ellesmere]|uniref:SDR family NAD(P)-dependent oxidoreductase n=1 Tax=Synechococcus sp. EJ6-Ellesmere TaxID=2823734 RepID=UPI0020CDD138|nr:SDR family NAD(P)-dependent oxidoreductase [Synechococcus sp. EJ6-Ellesmere]MCP9826556.1 SDR family NAD(P)-dependent oxidoreductase [Synechococcus sp. EJ6-Ellesmere]
MPRTLLISGASRGIGRAIATRLAAEGHRLSLGVRSPQAFEDTSLEPSAQVLLHPYKATEPASAEAWVAATAERFGAVDGLIHCAGVFSRAGLLFSAAEAADPERLWAVNLMGPWWLTRAAWPWLVRSGQGRIITLVSMSGKRVKGGLAAYATSKFALMALCDCMRQEGWEAGIRVTAICPSWVNTEMAAAVQAIPRQEMTQPEDLAAQVSLLLALPVSAVPFELAISCQRET